MSLLLLTCIARAQDGVNPTSGAMEFAEVFTSFEVYLVAAMCVAVVSGLKRGVVTTDRGSQILDRPGIGLLLAVGNIPLGAAMGLVPGFLPGEHVVERMMVGAVAGFMSNTLYDALKRFLPNVVESRDSDRRVAAWRQAQKEVVDAGGEENVPTSNPRQ